MHSLNQTKQTPSPSCIRTPLYAKRRSGGFTLIELLVVIAIIALLLSVLVTSLSKARKQANFVVCHSNLHNYGLAAFMYLQENQQVFPFPLTCIYSRSTFTSEHPAACRWHDAEIQPDGPLWPYMAAKNVNRCPEFASIARTRGAGHLLHDSRIPIRPQFTYSMNGYLSTGDEISPLNNKEQMRRMSQVKRPAGTLFIAEENIWLTHQNNTPPDEINLNTDALNDMYFYPRLYGNGDCIATFHKASDPKRLSGISNVLFLDGHVNPEKAFDEKDLSRRYSNKSYNLCVNHEYKKY
jgi:prepilin-type N-terminal cleavage/methylation domain-containing protein/prepilin-type processing-associated H-X9-DG protein